MQINPVDEYADLYMVSNIVSSDLEQKVLSTPWMDLEFVKQVGQEHWPRRLIVDKYLPWLDQWQHEILQSLLVLEQSLGIKLQPYSRTAFWIDEPGFTCGIHTDGEMPGSLHISWIGDSALGTTFYHSKNSNDVRFRHKFTSNSGYAMINMPDQSGYRHLQWHGMLEPVPKNSYRLTSYTWLIPIK
jgi:hypothetical protein